MIQQSNNHRQTGFTLVELMLAMAFVAMLLLAIAGVVLQIAGTYTKGTTMEAVNQAGRAIVTDMRRTIASSPQFDVTNVKKKTFILQRAGNATSGAILGGRLCTGTYSYIWNIGAAIANNQSPNVYLGTSRSTQIRFVKALDNGGVYCEIPVGSTNYPDIKKGDATELFADPNLAVQCFQINKMACKVTTDPVPAPTPLTNGTSRQLYDITVMISSANQEALTTVGDCKTPSEAGSYENYCAVNVFDFTVEAGNEGGQ